MAALHDAARRGHTAIVEQRLIHTAELHGAVSEGHTAFVTQLLAGGANVNVVDRYGRAALHLAASKGHTAIVEQLLAAGANANAVDQDGKRALDLAGNTVIKALLTRALVENQAAVEEKRDQGPIMAASRMQDPFAEEETTYLQPPFTYADKCDEKMDPELECSVCLSPLFEPMVHSKCIQSLCAKCFGNDRCPLCNVSVENSLTAAPRLVQNMLGKLLVKCRFCNKSIRRDGLQSHYRGNCPVSCPLGCGSTMMRQEVKDHANWCSHQEVACPAKSVMCPFVGLRMEVEDHAKSCHFVALEPVLSSLIRRIGTLEDSVRRAGWMGAD